MYLKKEKEFQYHPGIEKIIEDVIGGGTIARADMVGAAFGGIQLDELPPLVVVGKDSNGVWHVVKTAKIVAGGSASAPRLAKNHLFIVGNKISDGTVVLEINAVTKGDTYDTLGFDAGSLITSATETVLYAAETVDTVGGVPAIAAVTGTVGAILTVGIPVGSTPVNFNGLKVVISQASGDALTVAYASGKLTITLANTTASKNNAAAIQTAIRALGLVGVGLDLSSATATGGAGWDGAQTGAVLTAPSVAFANGVNYGVKPYLYTPEAITMNPVDLTVANKSSGLLVKGTVNESVLPFPIDAALKAALKAVGSDIRFV